MNSSPSAEFAQFRFMRDHRGGVITLPAHGMDEKILLVLDVARWGLARLHIFEEAAVRQDKLEAFHEELSKVSDLRSDKTSRLITWGRDGEELFYADAMLDGEPLPEYLGRVGGVPFPVAAEWITHLADFLESAPQELPSFERFSTLNFQVALDPRDEVILVFSEFFGWTKQGAQVREHSREWHLAQIFCSLMAGVPVRTFYQQSLPRNFEELNSEVANEVLAALEESGSGNYDRFRGVMRDLSQLAEECRASVPLPRMPIRGWIHEELKEADPGDREIELAEDWSGEGERYAAEELVRGVPSYLQILPGPELLPREGWLNQHHEATRRIGRAMLHQLHVTFIEDRKTITVVGEEKVEGISLSRLVLDRGSLSESELSFVTGTLDQTLRSLETGVGSCAVWWLPPENVLVVTGTSQVESSCALIERKGASFWETLTLKLRLHQTMATLGLGVNLPGPVRALSREAGKKNRNVRRAAVGLPLLFFLLSGKRFRWRRPVSEQVELARRIEKFFEETRLTMTENPLEVEDEFFARFSQVLADREMDDEELEEMRPDDGFESMLEATLHQEEIDFSDVTPAGVSGPGSSEGEELETLPDPFDEDEARSRWSVFGPWAAIWGAVLALIVGYILFAWNSEKGRATAEPEIEFPATHYEAPPAKTRQEVFAELGLYLAEIASPDLLPLLEITGQQGAAPELMDALKALAEERDGAAARFLALIYRFENRPLPKVAEQLELAAKLGDAEAQFLIAETVFVRGQRILSGAAARTYLERSASTGYAPSQELFATMLAEEGHGESALRWMRQASRQGEVGATYQLGLLEAGGSGESQAEKAAASFAKAAALGDARAMVAYGRCLEIGYGVEASFTEATRWMKHAAQLGMQSAQVWCETRGVEIDEETDEPSDFAAPEEGGGTGGPTN